MRLILALPSSASSHSGHRTQVCLGLGLCLSLTGCAVTATAPLTPETYAGAAITGVVHGGQQPVSGAHIYLYAANTTGYGGSGIAASTANASISLLNANVLTSNTGYSGQDANGNYYVVTDSNGNFTITGDYTCTAGQQVYLYALGGNSGSGTNYAVGLLAVLGNCPAAGNFLSSVPMVILNEVSTIAAAYAFAGFATDATHVSSSGTALAQTGIANAFATVANLETLATGTALAATPSTANGSSGIAPQSTVNTLANILASCINSSGALTGPANPSACYTLFTSAESSGATGTEPTDTATAAINMAHNPGVNIAALYALATPSSPFAPALATQPNDFTLSLAFSGGGLGLSSNGAATEPVNIAIDAAGNVWVTTEYNYVSEFSNAGAALSPPPSCDCSTGPGGYGWAYDPGVSFTNYVSTGSSGLALDLAGDAWVGDTGNLNGLANGGGGAGLAELNPSGSPLSPANLWGSPGEFMTGYGHDGFYGGGIGEYIYVLGSGLYYYEPFPVAIAIDASGNVWTANDEVTSGSGGVGSISEFSSSGVAISPSTGGTAANGYASGGSGYGGYTGGGITWPASIAIDGSGNVWTANGTIHESTYYGGIAKFSSSGTALSPAAGYQNGIIQPPNSCSLAIDATGNVWLANGQSYISGSSGNFNVFSNSGTPITPSSGYSGGGAAGVQMSSVAIDGAGHAWGISGLKFVEFTNSGVPVSPSTGYLASVTASSSYQCLAVDGSGNVWASDIGQYPLAGGYYDSYGEIIELVGAAAPVITPIAAGLPSTPTSNGSSNLGTRP